MITLTLTTTGLRLRRDDGYVCFARHGDDVRLAEIINDLGHGRPPRHYSMRPASPAPARPLFATRDAEDRRRAALSEERAALRDRIVRARSRRFVEI